MRQATGVRLESLFWGFIVKINDSYTVLLELADDDSRTLLQMMKSATNEVYKVFISKSKFQRTALAQYGALAQFEILSDYELACEAGQLKRVK